MQATIQVNYSMLGMKPIEGTSMKFDEQVPERMIHKSTTIFWNQR